MTDNHKWNLLSVRILLKTIHSSTIISVFGLFLLLAIILTSGSVVVSYGQIGPTVPLIPSSTFPSTGFPELLAMSSSETTAHELPLKAIKSGEVSSKQDFKIEVSNIIGVPLNGKLTVFSTENIQITNVKLTNTENQVAELTPVQNVVSLYGFPQGVYTLDVIVSKDGVGLAYEGILVVGQSLQNAAVNQVIEKETHTDVKVVFENLKQQPKKITDKEKICLFTPGHPICKPPPGGCPKDWGRNEDGQCFPIYKKCPPGYWRADNDETGACVPLPKVPLGFAALPPCDGSFQDCITERGDVCEAGSGAHECEVDEPELSCQEEDDFCEPGCESPSMDCIDDVNIGDDGEDSTNEEESGNEEEETANCGGEPCTPTEKEDSWTDEEEEEEESNDESSGDEEAAADEEAAVDEGGN